MNNQYDDRFRRDGAMWCDLWHEDLAAKSAGHRVTMRALIYVSAGLPLDRVLDALKLDEAAWTERVQELEHWQAENVAASRRISAQLDAGAAATKVDVPQSAGVLP